LTTQRRARPAATEAPARSLKRRRRLSTAFARPRSALETGLAAVLSEVLDCAPIGRNDDFFELGGNSLLGMRVTEIIRERLGVQIPPRRFYEGPNVTDLAVVVRELKQPDQIRA
jgi:hypothetical protein